MHSNYEDIMALSDKAPQWWDMNGTPRFAEFEPELCPSIYAKDVFLLEIACQHCSKRFDVEMHTGWAWRSALHSPKHLHYGDPPVHGCTGDTMNCEDLTILEAWHRGPTQEWERMSDLEGPMNEA